MNMDMDGDSQLALLVLTPAQQPLQITFKRTKTGLSPGPPRHYRLPKTSHFSEDLGYISFYLLHNVLCVVSAPGKGNKVAYC